MLCTNGHNNSDDAKFCFSCGSNTFQAGTQSGIVNSYTHSGSAITTNGMAIASMVLGICWVYWIGSILALVFGYIARRQIKTSGQKGNGMAIAGIVLGWVAIAFFVVTLIVGVSANN